MSRAAGPDPFTLCSEPCADNLHCGGIKDWGLSGTRLSHEPFNSMATSPERLTTLSKVSPGSLFFIHFLQSVYNFEAQNICCPVLVYFIAHLPVGLIEQSPASRFTPPSVI